MNARALHNRFRLYQANNNLRAVSSVAAAASVNWDQLDGVTNASGTLSKSAADGAFNNAVAYSSTQAPAGDFTLTFTLPSSFDGAAVGLKLVSNGVPTKAGGIAQYDYCLNNNDSDVFGATSQVFELGSNTTASYATPGTDVCIIQRVGTTITYTVGGVLRYTNNSASAAALYIGANPYANTGKGFLSAATIG